MAHKTQGFGRIAGSTALRRCLGTTMVSGALVLASAAPAAAQGMTICHATGNPGAPFIQITVGPEGPGPHGVHEGDLIPAPAGGCPTSLEPVATATPVATVEPVPVPVTDPATEPDTAVTSPAVEVESRSTETAAEQRSGAREVRRARRQRRAARRVQAAEPAPAPAPAAAPAAAPAVAQARPVRARLPFTGYETLFVAMTGVGFMMLGAGMRLTALRDDR